MNILERWEEVSRQGGKLRFNVLNKDREETECEMLFSFENAGKSYIVYTDHSVDAAGNTEIYASVVDPDNPNKLIPIETREEWNLVRELLQKMQKASE